MAQGFSSTVRPIVRPPVRINPNRPGSGSTPPRRPGDVVSGPARPNPNIPRPTNLPDWASSQGAQRPPAPGAPAGTHPVTTTVPGAPPDLSGAKWQGYLTPDQLGQLNAAHTTFGINIGTQQRQSGIQLDANGQPVLDAAGNPTVSQSGDAEIQYNQAVQNAQDAHDRQMAAANEQLAARGLFQSSIRDNDLSDIDAAMVERQGNARAALTSLIAEAVDTIGKLNAGWAGDQSYWQGIAIGQVPTPPPVTTTTNVPNNQRPGQVSPVNPTGAPVQSGRLISQNLPKPTGPQKSGSTKITPLSTKPPPKPSKPTGGTFKSSTPKRVK